MNYYEKRLVTKMLAVWVSLFASLLILWAGYRGFLMPEIDKPAIWFQRSGSVVILITVFAELFVIKRLRSISDGQEITARAKFKNYISITNIFDIAMSLIGTVVWGYGDLIYMEVLS
ncbi:hypothetical protein [Moritella sp. JT01]|uniref:hypothetical protein n=1 Tax=Moritella sp. JT01 TaxID=756698 RepID=UPI00082B5ADC|nr:hypothetical protein [Moritella sp. JT01]